MDPSAKSKTELSSSSCTVDDNSSKTSSVISATSSSPPLPQQNIQRSSFDEKNQYFVSSSFSNTDSTWVSNNPLIEKAADTYEVMAPNQQEQSQKRPAPVQTSALLTSQPSDFGGVNPITTAIITPTTFVNESVTSWTTNNPEWETTTDLWKSSISDTSSKDTSWATAQTSSPPVESELETEQEIASQINDININSNQQQQNYPVPITSSNYCTTSTVLPPTPTAETHSSNQLAQWSKELPTPSSSRRGTVEYIGGRSSGGGGWGKGELVNDWEQFNQVIENITSSASSTTKIKPIPMPLESEVSSYPNTNSFENPYSFQQQQQEHANWSKTFTDNSGVIQEEKITMDLPSPYNDSLPTATASSAWTSYSFSDLATEQVWCTSNVNAPTTPPASVMTTTSGVWTDSSRGVQHDTSGTVTTTNNTWNSPSHYAQQEKTTSTTITTESANWNSPPRPTTQHTIATKTTAANTDWSVMPDVIDNGENVKWSTTTSSSGTQAMDTIPKNTLASSNVGTTTIPTTTSTGKPSAAAASPWPAPAPTTSISSSSFSHVYKTDTSNVVKTLKNDPKLDFAKALWDDVSDEPGKAHDIAKSLPAKTTSMIKSSTKQYYGNTSNDSIHNPDRIVDDEEEEEEWVTSNIQAFQSPTPTSSFATDPSFAPSPPTTTSSSSSSGNIIHSHRYAREELYDISTQQGHDIGHHAASLVNKQMQG